MPFLAGFVFVKKAAQAVRGTEQLRMSSRFLLQLAWLARAHRSRLADEQTLKCEYKSCDFEGSW